MKLDRCVRALCAAAGALAVAGCISMTPPSSTTSPTLAPITTPAITLAPITLPPITLPPITIPPVTAPPITAPPITAPPVTQPPVTQPPVTAPPDTPPPPVTPEPGATPATQLDWNQPANYGEMPLDSGFVPDPQTKTMTSGGSVDASYLGGDCKGWATSAPDLTVRYTVGTFTPSRLRFYFIPDSSGDTTMIINDQVGQWHCNDDSYSTFNPTVEFPNPSSGRYDIWIGSYLQNTPIHGTLYITELDSNHP